MGSRRIGRSILFAGTIALAVAIPIAGVRAEPAAIGPKVNWTRQFGSGQYDEAKAIVASARGITYVVGSTSGALPGQKSHGGGDAYIRSQRPGGKVRWTRQFGTTTYDVARGVAIDRRGNVIVAGGTDGSMGGPNRGKTDAWVRKFSATGRLLWSRQFGTAEPDDARYVAVDGSGNVYVVGETTGALQGTGEGSSDTFIRKYSSAGKHRWTRQFGISGQDYVEGAAADSKGNAWVLGGTDGALQGANLGDFDAFVRKYGPTGQVRWTRQFGTSGSDFAYDGVVDRRGYLYVFGQVEGSLAGQTDHGSVDVFIRKLAPNGRPLWTRQSGTSAADYAGRAGIDRLGNTYVVGSTRGTLAGQTSSGESDAFLQAFRPDGRRRWTTQFGTPQDDFALGVGVDANAHLFVAGSTNGSLGGPQQGLTDVFVRRYLLPS